MGQAQSFGQIFIKAECAGNRPANLRDLKTMSEPHPKVIPIWRHKHLRFVPQSAEGNRMNDPVPVPLEGAARATRAAIWLWVIATPALRGIASVRRAVSHPRLVGPKLAR